MSGHEAVCGTGEASVSKKRHGVAKACSDKCCSNRKHFTHTGATLWTFVADNDDISSFDDTFVNGGERGFFAVEDARGTAEILQIVARDFYDAAFWSEISFQDDESAGRFERRVKFADDLLRWRFFGCGGFFGESASGDSDSVAAEQSSFKEALCDERSAACGVEIGSDKSSSGFEICNDRDARTDAIKIVNRKRDFRFVGDGQKVQHGVCGAAGRGDAGDGVLNRRFSNDFRGSKVTAEKIEDELTGTVTSGRFSCICRRNTGESHWSDT